jgi:glycosyltransferase involved in cell wall biosynthesis
VPDGDFVALASILARLLQDKQLRRHLGDEAMRWAQTYDWAHIADRILGVYREARSMPLSIAA